MEKLLWGWCSCVVRQMPRQCPSHFGLIDNESNFSITNKTNPIPMATIKPRLSARADGGRPRPPAGGGRACVLRLREAVRSGQATYWASGYRPAATSRSDLGLSRVTVEAAYAQLETEGYLRRQVGQGSFVAIDMQRATAAPSRRTPLRSGLAGAVGWPGPRHCPRCRGAGSAWWRRGAAHEPERAARLRGGQPRPAGFPHRPVAPVAAAAAAARRRQPLMFYGDPQGLPALREAIARYLALVARGALPRRARCWC